MQYTVTICDVCKNGNKETKVYSNPVTGESTDRCGDHVPGVYCTSVSGFYYGNSYPSEEPDIDLQYRYVEPGRVEVTFAGDSFELTYESVVEMYNAYNAMSASNYGCFEVTGTVKLVTSDYVAEDVDLEELVAFMDHNWSEGDFEY